MSWMNDELDYQKTSAEEYRWFDAGMFFGLVLGGTVALLYYHGGMLEWVSFYALWAILWHFKALQRGRQAVDWVEATVKRWAGL